MAQPKPDLKLIDSATGELVEDDRDLLIEQLQAELKGKSLQIGKLKRELKELRSVEPEQLQIRQVLDYWRQRCKPRATIAPASKRWEKVRARLKDKLEVHGEPRPGWTVAELKLAVDGALLDPWLNGKAKGKKWLDAETIFRDAEMVERLRDTALGFKAQANVGLAELLEVADELCWVNWTLLLQTCECGHRRIEHSRPDPDRDGLEGCRISPCPCEDFDRDIFEELAERQAKSPPARPSEAT